MKYYLVNNKINSPEVRLIDENDQYLGIMEIKKALAIAQERGLDLIEIDPKAQPPVAKITNFGQFKYNLRKKEKQQKKQQKVGEIKGVRLTLRIGQHDLNFKAEKTKEFLNQNQKVKIDLVLKGREKVHFNLAKDLVDKFINLLGENIKIEQPPLRQGNCLTALVVPYSKDKDTYGQNS